MMIGMLLGLVLAHDDSSLLQKRPAASTVKAPGELMAMSGSQSSATLFCVCLIGERRVVFRYTRDGGFEEFEETPNDFRLIGLSVEDLPILARSRMNFILTENGRRPYSDIGMTDLLFVGTGLSFVRQLESTYVIRVVQEELSTGFLTAAPSSSSYTISLPQVRVAAVGGNLAARTVVVWANSYMYEDPKAEPEYELMVLRQIEERWETAQIASEALNAKFSYSSHSRMAIPLVDQKRAVLVRSKSTDEIQPRDSFLNEVSTPSNKLVLDVVDINLSTGRVKTIGLIRTFIRDFEFLQLCPFGSNTLAFRTGVAELTIVAI